LTTLSHLCFFCNHDGLDFKELEGYDSLIGKGILKSFGVEDCRVALIDVVYYLTYTVVSDNGVGVGLRATTNWKEFQHHGMLFPIHKNTVRF
jgi:predicted GH43/DUF377 family glycosyl hydrolase